MSKTKSQKELIRRYGNLAENLLDYQNHIDFRFFDNFNDEAFLFLMKNVKGVNMLDLNETDVTKESIKFLTNLEYVNEIRAKECENLTDDCTEILNQLPTLTFLHLKNTKITIDGLLKLENLKNLETLMFSENDILSIKEKLIQLKLMHLNCELIINSKPYFFNTFELFISFLKNKPFLFRLKIKNLDISRSWSEKIANPIPHYIAAESQGKFHLDEVEWIEIKTLETEREKSEDFQELQKFLDTLEFPYLIDDEKIGLYIIESKKY
jgi:hypothetical protein